MNSRDSGIIFNIQHYCIHDGPGIRTNVFFKGCPLRCAWCANPESNEVRSQLMYLADKCVGCLSCIPKCSRHAISAAENGKVRTDRKLCDGCGECVSACLPQAREIMGKRMTVDEVYKEVSMDQLFYAETGGVTLTGGEVLSQPEFAAAILRKCRDNRIHTAVETCGYASWEAVQTVMEYVDLVLYDIKHMDSGEHKRGTGVGNEKILDNLCRISNELNIPVIARTPMLPGYNDSEGNMRAMGQFLTERVPTCREVNLLPYHKLGEGKREQLEYEESQFHTYVPSEQEMETLRQFVREYGLNVK
ncbi:glycyl-radical enzyme activating protein [Clostridium sp. MCC353]|uniref:glycyl-radical enzyme activating protein n=1 Tax=Clostridium sp. MCC353 TaxID=2592646 RepID=UPI001C025686|nr:glycyl-radical enzyme activating protein [Clostridium sp. MCC353]MBT9775477.1 glycyl-radical enzyme activating protein [Clostridium sp. MCC353]